jgi:glycosyltransferase involved in cell wall biosynthesis
VNEYLNSLGVCIPCHVKSEQDLTLLYRALESIRSQTLQPREIVVSDDSPKGVSSSKIMAAFPELNIKVIRNLLAQGIAGNSNFGVSHLNTEWIQVLHQDDWLTASSSYEEIMKEIRDLDQTYRWFLVSGLHEDGSSVVPVWKKSNLFGFNSIGGPSCLFTRNTDFIQYDERFKMLVDVKNYSDYFNSYGNPGIIEPASISYGNPPTRVSQNMPLDQTLEEMNLILKMKAIEFEDIIECLNDSALNPYHRFLLLKLAKENKRINLNLYFRHLGSLVFARLKFKLKNIFESFAQ